MKRLLIFSILSLIALGAIGFYPMKNYAEPKDISCQAIQVLEEDLTTTIAEVSTKTQNICEYLDMVQ